MNCKQNHFRCRQEFSCYELCGWGPHYCCLLAESFLEWGIYVTKCDEVKCWTWAQDLLLDSALIICDPVFSVQIAPSPLSRSKQISPPDNTKDKTILPCATSKGTSILQRLPQRIRCGKLGCETSTIERELWTEREGYEVPLLPLWRFSSALSRTAGFQEVF